MNPEIMICPICTNKFVEPRLLPCGETICTECAQKQLRNKKCPFCQEAHNIANLPLNKLINRLCLEKKESKTKVVNGLYLKLDGLRARTKGLTALIERPMQQTSAFFSNLKNKIQERKQCLFDKLESDHMKLIDELNAYMLECELNSKLEKSNKVECNTKVVDLVREAEAFYDYFYNELDSINLDNVSDKSLDKLSNAIRRSDYLIGKIDKKNSRNSPLIICDEKLLGLNLQSENLIGRIEAFDVKDLVCKDSLKITKNKEPESNNKLCQHVFKYVRSIDLNKFIENGTASVTEVSLMRLDHDKYLLSFIQKNSGLMKMFVLDAHFNLVFEKRNLFHSQQILFGRVKFCCERLIIYLVIKTGKFLYQPTMTKRILVLLDKDTLNITYEQNDLGLTMYDDMTCNEENVFLKTKNENSLIIMNMKLEIISRVLTDQPGVFFFAEGFQRIFSLKDRLIFLFQDKKKAKFAKILNLITNESRTVEFFSKNDHARMNTNLFLFLLDSNHLVGFNFYKRMQVYDLQSGETFIGKQLEFPNEIDNKCFIFEPHNINGHNQFFLFNKSTNVAHIIDHDFL
jgi:hypothetical protein